jgi:hypothetical protein
MTRSRTANIVLCTSATLVALALVVLIAVELWRSRRPCHAPDKAVDQNRRVGDITAFASVLGSTSASTSPMLQLQIQWSGAPHVDTTLSGLVSNLLIHGSADHPVFPGRASFLTGTVSVPGVCNTFDGLAAPSWSREWSITPASWQSVPGLTQQPLMGVAQATGSDGRYLSTFLRMLAENGFSAWSVMVRVRQAVVFPGTLTAACVRWQWTPLVPRPDDGLYVIRLAASPAAPWLFAVCDPGRYYSVLPGVAGSDQTITLQTTDNLAIFVNATMYDSQADAADAPLKAVLAADNSVCVLGLAALAWFSAACFDIGNQRLGILTTRIGNVVQLAATPTSLQI